MSGSILTKLDAGVLHISLNNPDKYNALTHDMLIELTELLEDAPQNKTTRVVVLRGEGKAFCTGIDLRHIEDMASMTKQQHKKDVKLLSDLLAAVIACPLPVIAIGHGKVFGAGIGLLAAADIAVAFESTTFSFSEVNLGLVPSLEILTREFSERAQIPMDATLEDLRLDSPDARLVVYRIVQESLTNAGKYARAARVRVRVAQHPAHAEVMIEDDGVGFDAGAQLPRATHGLQGMRHRVEAMGGRLAVESAPGAGTRVVWWDSGDQTPSRLTPLT